MRLIPGSGLDLTITGRCPEVEALRFLSLFRSMWRKLPALDCRDILRHWLPVTPRILLADDCGPDRLGLCSASGQRIEFAGILLSWHPPGQVQAVQAHELCHVLRRARGVDLPDEEDLVNRQVEAWGFPMRSVYHWEYPPGACSCHYRMEDREAARRQDHRLAGLSGGRRAGETKKAPAGRWQRPEQRFPYRR